MKRILYTTALLALTSGFAAAEVTLSGDARMGIIGDGDDVYFTHRVRAKFTLSGESDAGFSFGASFRPSNAYEANEEQAGEVFISGAFGTLTMGDTDSAAQATVGQVDGVGLTGLGDLNEILLLGDLTTSARYDYSTGGLTLSASYGQHTANDYSVAAAYAFDGYKFSIGHEKNGTGLATAFWGSYYALEKQTVLGADATFGAVTMKARYSMADAVHSILFTPPINGIYDAKFTQYALSATYAMDALSLTAFVAGDELSATGVDNVTNTDRIGLGAAYDLGGGASLKAGYANSATTDCFETEFCADVSYDTWDLGLSFEF
jgi:outer membrane protein OmpU